MDDKRKHMLTSQIIAQTIARTLNGLDPKQTKAMIKRIVQTLAKRNEISVLKKSWSKLAEVLDQQQGLTKVEVTSAHKLHKTSLEALAKKLNLDYKQINFICTEDASVISGLVARTNNLEIDARLQTRLNHFLN